ncbi:MAG: hypothetical protein ACMUIE_04515 [Thermoplasmatota archaeon]
MLPKDGKDHRFLIPIVIVSLSMALMVISMIPGMTWASFDRSSSIGPANYRLQADFDAVGFDYRIDIGTQQGGIIGGIGGTSGNRTVEDGKAYPLVRGEVFDKIGLLYDSYRIKSFPYELKMRSPPQDSGIEWDQAGNPAAYLNITLESDLIPWWPEGMSRKMTVRATLSKVDLLDQVSQEQIDRFRVEISKITLKAQTGYDKETGSYTGPSLDIAEKTTKMVFNDPGMSFSTQFEVDYPEGSDAAGFFVEVVGNMTDFWGRTELSPLPGKPNNINVYPMSRGQFVQGIGIVLALPLMMISVILGSVFIVRSSVKKRAGLGLIIPAFILSVLAPLWFSLGISTAVELLGERLENAPAGLSHGIGIYLSASGAAFMLCALAAVVIIILLERKGGSKIELPPGRDKELSPAAGPSFKRIDQNSEADPSAIQVQETAAVFQQANTK